jgi:hypothetical protein
MIQLTLRRNAETLCFTATMNWISFSYNVLNFVCSTEWPSKVHVNTLTFPEFLKLQRHYSSVADNATSNMLIEDEEYVRMCTNSRF